MNDSDTISFDMPVIDFGDSMELSRPINQQTFQNDVLAISFFKFHRTHPCFTFWRLQTNQSKEEEVKEVTICKNHYIRIVQNAFSKWKSRRKLKVGLKSLGKQIELTVPFLRWKFISNVRQYCQNSYTLILKIAQHHNLYRYFTTWKKVKEIKSTYLKYNSNQILLRRTFRAFHRVTKQISHLRTCNNNLLKFEKTIAQFSFFDLWNYKCRIARKYRYIQRTSRKKMKADYYTKWVQQFKIMKRRRQLLTQFIWSQKRLQLRKSFDEWFNRFDIITRISNAQDAYDSTFSIRTEKRYFFVWLERFDKLCFMKEAEESITSLHLQTTLQHFINRWIDNTRYEQSIRDDIDAVSQDLQFFKLKFLTEKWRALTNERVAFASDVLNASKILKKGIVRRRFEDWLSEFRIVSANRTQYRKAREFHRLCLLLKGVSGLKRHCASKSQEKTIKTRHESIVLKNILMKWKSKTMKRKKLELMIKSVLVAYGSDIKKKAFNSWKDWILLKKKKHNEYQKAIEESKTINLSIALEGFVQGANLIINKNAQSLNRPVIQYVIVEPPCQTHYEKETENASMISQNIIDRIREIRQLLLNDQGDSLSLQQELLALVSKIDK